MTPDPWCNAVRHGGTATAYRRGCRCTAARARMALLARRRRNSGPQRIDATGSRRRLQALMRAGWSSTQLGPMLYVHHTQVVKWLRLKQITVKSAERIASLYDEIGLAEGPSYRNRARALKASWPLPEEWGDDIDDPKAKPLTATRRRGRGDTIPYDDVEHLARFGESWPDIESRLGFARNSIQTGLRKRGLDHISRMISRNTDSGHVHANQWTA